MRGYLVLTLYGSGFHMVIVLGGEFTRRGPSAESARTAIVADAIHRVVVHHRTAVDIGDIRHIDIGYRPIIEEAPAPPFPPFEAPAVVSEPIIDAAVEANVWSPVSGMPKERASTPAPIAWSPKHGRRRRHHPSSGHPEVAVVGIVSPIARRPHVARAWTNRLRIDRQRWRTNPN